MTINPNYSNRNKFKFMVHFNDTKNFEFFAKGFTFGGLNIGTYIRPTPIRMMEYPGDSYEAEDIVIDFYIDEDWNSYKEMFRWLKRVKNGDNSLQDFLLFADLTITILNTKFRPIFNIVLKDCFPYSLTTINLDNDDDIAPLMGQILLKVNDYHIEDVN